MWQLLTHESPFQDKSTFDAAATVAMEKGRPPFPEDTPKNVRDLVEACWAHDPEQRPSFDEVVSSLKKIEADLTEDEQRWLDVPLGHKVYSRPVYNKSTNKPQVQLQIPKFDHGHHKKEANKKPAKPEKQDKKRFGLFSRKSSVF